MKFIVLLFYTQIWIVFPFLRFSTYYDNLSHTSLPPVNTKHTPSDL